MSALEWRGAVVVCIASGPSLSPEDVALVDAARVAHKCRVMAVNREFESAPWADVLYAADYHFWQAYIDEVRAKFCGALWTIDKRAAHQFKLNLVARGRGEGYATELGTINTGGNSGYQAIHLAAQWGAARVIMLGYDMQRTDGKEHHYGKHKKGLPNGAGFKSWIPRFKPLFRDLRLRGVEVINATRVTAIPEDWIPRVPLEELL